MAYPTQSVQVRRAYYHSISKPIATVAYEDPTDWNITGAVQDPVIAKDPKITVTGYSWDFYKTEWYFSAT